MLYSSLYFAPLVLPAALLPLLLCCFFILCLCQHSLLKTVFSLPFLHFCHCEISQHLLSAILSSIATSSSAVPFPHLTLVLHPALPEFCHHYLLINFIFLHCIIESTTCIIFAVLHPTFNLIRYLAFLLSLFTANMFSFSLPCIQK